MKKMKKGQEMIEAYLITINDFEIDQRVTGRDWSEEIKSFEELLNQQKDEKTKLF